MSVMNQRPLSMVWLIEPASGKMFLSPEVGSGYVRIFCVSMSTMCTLYFDKGHLSALKDIIELAIEELDHGGEKGKWRRENEEIT